MQQEAPRRLVSPGAAKAGEFVCEYHRKYSEAMAEVARLKALLEQLGGGNLSLKARALTSPHSLALALASVRSRLAHRTRTCSARCSSSRSASRSSRRRSRRARRSSPRCARAVLMRCARFLSALYAYPNPLLFDARAMLLAMCRWRW